MVDASAPLEQQDVTIANRAAEAGAPLVVAANKWDLVDEPQAALALLRDRLESRLPHLKGIACLPISVRTGKNLDRLLPLVVEAHERWSTRIATAPLNRWLAEATAAHPPPMAKGRRVKIRYATQVSTRPPTFVLFVSQAGALHRDLSALPDQQPARSVRPAGRAAPPAPAHRQKPFRVTPWRARPRFRRRR